MGTITIQALAEQAWTSLNDTLPTQGVRWTAAEMLTWHNAAQRAVVVVLPSAHIKTAVPALLPGTRQTLQAIGLTDARWLVAMHYNVEPDGIGIGRSVTVVPKRTLDERMPMWHAAPAGQIQHYCVDAEEPGVFWVSPRPLPGYRVSLSYTALPAAQASLSEPIILADQYANAIGYYMLMRAHAKNANTAVGSQQMLVYQQLFNMELGVSDSRLKELDPNRQLFSDGAGVAGPGS